MPQTEPINCCGTKPALFRDTRVGSTQQMWVVNCGKCGRFSEDTTKNGAIEKFNARTKPA